MPLTNEEMNMIIKWMAERRSVAEAAFDALTPEEQAQLSAYIDTRTNVVDARLNTAFREMADDATLGEVMEMYREQYGDEPTEK
jgi:uncharacterized protein YecT (DUF1311 family)